MNSNENFASIREAVIPRGNLRAELIKELCR